MARGAKSGTGLARGMHTLLQHSQTVPQHKLLQGPEKRMCQSSRKTEGELGEIICIASSPRAVAVSLVSTYASGQRKWLQFVYGCMGMAPEIED
ncbi:hypothetical protein Sango_0188800 [Sesamum angolense]|uniref:Uncharacterized protein n=1 Tax=Sesamum angolense TaxID=2727404 RepID=A0AAE1XG33_9LAMI|nr:hypothetical protein Sango_0188800 [Sesamum angolense]